MGANFNRILIPEGSQVVITNHDNPSKFVASGALLEDYTISLSSEFGQLIDSGANDAFTVLGGALKSLSGNRFGFSSQFKQMGFQIWKGSNPIQLQFSLEFHYTYNAYEEIIIPVKRLCRIPLPSEGEAGNLVPPGPSVLEAISGTKTSNTPPSSDTPTQQGPEIDEEATISTADNYVNISVGGMVFMGCILKSAEPTFSKYVDETGYPIYARVAIVADTMYTATKESISGW
jgi:hypothetical protein